MRFLSTRVNGYIDYVIGILLIISPWLFAFHRGGAEAWVPIILGIALIVYSLFTDYELGMVKSIPMSTHLWLDALGGLILLISPWIFGFSGHVWVPHFILGLIEIGNSFFTQAHPAHREVRARA